MTPPWLDVKDLVVRYGRGARSTTAVDGVTLRLERGEAVGLVGESGCGKSSLGRALLGLEAIAGGTVAIEGTDMTVLMRSDAMALRRRMQMVFQDPYGSLNPRLSVGHAVGEVLAAHRIGEPTSRSARVSELLRQVGLDPEVAHRYPHEFSGGQRQRICIARALAVGPEFLVADEPVSALDVSVQAQVMNLFRDLRNQLGLTCLFIAHDLAVVRYLCSRVCVMYRGRVVEEGPTEQVFRNPAHPYTKLLLASVPDVRRGREPGVRSGVAGAHEVAEVRHTGCTFEPRCGFRVDRCRAEAPVLGFVAEARKSACHRADDVVHGRCPSTEALL